MATDQQNIYRNLERKKRYTDYFQDVATLGSERPEENNANSGFGKQPGEGAKKARYSGAARRRYKKVLQRKAMEEADQVLTMFTGGAEETEAEEVAMAGAIKRLRSEQGTSNLSIGQQDMKPRLSDQSSYTLVAAELFRVAIVSMTYPEVKFGDEEVQRIKKQVRNRILGLAKGAKAPTFRGTYVKDGAVIFNCTNEETGAWLESITPELSLKGEVQVRSLRLEELEKRQRIVVHVEDPTMTVKEALDYLDRQNEGLETEEWILHNRSESRDATSFHFAAFVEDRTLAVLEDLKFKPFCGLDQATVNLTENTYTTQRMYNSTSLPHDKCASVILAEEHCYDADINNTYSRTLID